MLRKIGFAILRTIAACLALAFFGGGLFFLAKWLGIACDWIVTHLSTVWNYLTGNYIVVLGIVALLCVGSFLSEWFGGILLSKFLKTRAGKYLASKFGKS